MRHWSWVFVLVVACGDDAPMIDAGARAQCESDSDCSDGTFCNGEEVCDPESPLASAFGCLPGMPPCDSSVCDEDNDECRFACQIDADGDGVRSIECGGTDCDDDDPRRFPGNVEVCDEDDFDEDCDLTTFGYRDVDGDRWPDAACCNREGDEQSCGNDCDDDSPGINPSAPEVCNESDDDCDGDVDEEVIQLFWIDEDGDGFAADGAEPLRACSAPDGYAAMRGDCDDTTRGVNPGVRDRCDAMDIDDDCNGTPNDPPEGCACSDGDTRPCALPGRCASGSQACTDGAWNDMSCSVQPLAEVCNGEDDDCDDAVDENEDGTSMRINCWTDDDRDTFAPLGDPSTTSCSACPPGTTDIEPTAEDFDCDDEDENLGVPPNLYIDADGDGFGDPFRRRRGCPGDDGLSTNGDDCSDGNPQIRPNQTEFFEEPTHYVCPSGTNFPCIVDDEIVGCVFWMPPFTLNCSNPQPRIGIWSWDCDDAGTKPRDHRCSCGFEGLCADGYQSSAGACGTQVPYNMCGFGFCSSMAMICSTESSVMRTLPCR